jgi:allantoate deiminase
MPTDAIPSAARRALDRCDLLAKLTLTPGCIERPFLCPPAADVHKSVIAWMQAAGLQTRIDAIGNLWGQTTTTTPAILIGSHLDTVPNAGRFDGILGVCLGIAIAELAQANGQAIALNVVGFSEEEGVRYARPYLGSLAAVGKFDPAWLATTDSAGIPLRTAIQSFGLDPAAISTAKIDPASIAAYLEVHIEQGPVLESLSLPLGVVSAIAGQSRLRLAYHGAAAHAGTCPMNLRHDALVAAAEFVQLVESIARQHDGLVATVGVLNVAPNASNVVPDHVRFSLDIRHATDAVREKALASLLAWANDIAARRDVTFQIESRTDHPAVPMHPTIQAAFTDSIQSLGQTPHTLVSGAGHDAAILASITRAGMLFIRSPRGISHHPDEAVIPEDVTHALAALWKIVQTLTLSEGNR